MPTTDAAVLIKAGTSVTYDTLGDVALKCVEVEGRLTFRTDTDTRMKVATLTVLETGALEIGTGADPIAADVTAELVIADRRLDIVLDQNQFGTGLIGLGRITVHGAIKSPTFVRLAREPMAGQTTLESEEPISGWRTGNKLVLPDTRHLKQDQRGTSYRAQWEELTIDSVSGRTVTLVAPLAFSHPGARSVENVLELLPHVGNVSRNVIVRSENPKGTRGHVFFVNRPDVDIRYALFKDLGRTRMGVLDNTEYDADGRLIQIGTNQRRAPG